MGSRFTSCRFIFYVLLVSQCTHTNCIREITKKTWKDANKEASDLQQTAIDDNLQIFFTVDDLKVGKTISIYFPIKDPSTTPHLLTREEANSIPFSSSKLPQILDFFSFSKHSPQAKAMQYTLSQCELEPLKGETNFCATSLEFMLDSARGMFGLKKKFRVLTTKYLSSHNAVLQNYTVLDVAKEIETPKMVACHAMPFTLTLFFTVTGKRVITECLRWHCVVAMMGREWKLLVFAIWICRSGTRITRCFGFSGLGLDSLLSVIFSQLIILFGLHHLI